MFSEDQHARHNYGYKNDGSSKTHHRGESPAADTSVNEAQPDRCTDHVSRRVSERPIDV
jgi:hypothetical protein